MTSTTEPPAGRYRLLRLTKDYWFLVTVITSVILSGVYMYVFHVTPWDTYRQIEMRRNRVALYDRIGQRLLESGQYELAIAEFDRAFALDPVDDPAQAGRYLAQLFVALPKPTWEATVWSAERDALTQLVRGREGQIGHVIEKYLGDVELRIANEAEAAMHYEKALAMKPDYPDALQALGWYSYSVKPDAARMETLFRKMTEVDPYDYRGFHGLGYALYIRALTTGGTGAVDLIHQAAEQSHRASGLKFQQLNVAVDFGEVARTVLPQVSQGFHEYALQMLDDPETANLPQVRDRLEARLLKSPGERSVYIQTDRQRHAWLQYEMALDHLATARQLDAGDQGAGRKEHEAHDRLLQMARKLDPDSEIYRIYRDQLAILDQFIPVASPRRHGA